eukprot:10057117-Ditylum_brightwellii.AAC.1
MRTLEAGLSHHHSKCCTVRMRKANGCIFNNQNWLPCNITTLDLICPCHDFTHLAHEPSLAKVTAALCQMANGKAPGLSGITSNALIAMVWMEHLPENDTDNDDVEYLVSVIHITILKFWNGHLDFQSWESRTLAP